MRTDVAVKPTNACNTNTVHILHVHKTLLYTYTLICIRWFCYHVWLLNARSRII